MKSIEDHGYNVDLGVPDVSGFLPFEDTGKRTSKLHIGQVIDVTVTKISGNGRICSVSMDEAKLATSFVSPFPGFLFSSYVCISSPKFLPSTLCSLVPLYNVW